MAMIFPGMDPYLEKTSYWGGFHNLLAVALQSQLRAQVSPRYVVANEGRIYFPGRTQPLIPDVWLRPRNPATGATVLTAGEADAPEILELMSDEINEPYLEILDRDSKLAVVTTIEIVSPTNKSAGTGRKKYRAKQRAVLRSTTHLVEIDLLRRGRHVIAAPEEEVRERYQYDHLACVNRAEGARDRYELYPRQLEQPLPRVRVPLAGDDPDARIDLQAAAIWAYTQGDFVNRIDYTRPCEPPLTPEQQAWADALIRAATSPS